MTWTWPYVVGAIAVFWIVCGVLAYGLAFGHVQTKFELSASRGALRSDRYFACSAAVFGPVGLVAILQMLKVWAREDGEGADEPSAVCYRSPWKLKGLI